MEHKHKWASTVWKLINPNGPCNMPRRYLDLEICRVCGMIRVAPHDMERIMEGEVMGEMADYINDSMFVDESEDEETCSNPSLSCKYCGKSPLWWWETEEGWRLIDQDRYVHQCKKYKKSGKFVKVI